MYQRRLIYFIALTLLLLGSVPALNIANKAWGPDGFALPETATELWSVDSAEGLLALTLWRCCGRSIREGRVVVGKNGFLFLGNDFDQVIDKTTGRYQPSPTERDDWAASIARLARQTQAVGATFTFVLAPNKHGIYPQYLPDGVGLGPQSMTDKVLSALDARGVSLVDLRDVLKTNAGTAPTYLKTDTHWTKGGAALGYLTVFDALNENGASVQPLALDISPRLAPAGDLARMLKIDKNLGLRHEIDQQVMFADRPICEVANAFTAQTPVVCDHNTAEPLPLLQDRGGVSSVSPKAQNAQTLLMICDSFCEAHRALFQASFAQAHFIHWKAASKLRFNTLLDQLAPDIVLFQLVERSLLLPQLKM